MSERAASAPATSPTGTIYDIGYQHYTGIRLGRLNAIRTLTAFSFRAAFGQDRGQKARILPLIVIVLIFLPVVVQIALASASGRPDVINFGQRLEFTSFILAIFAAAQAPEIITTDRQYGTLSLYLSRPINTADYITAKLIAFVGAMLVLTVVPQLMLFLGKVVLSAAPWQGFLDNRKVLWPLVGGTALVSCYMAFLGMALASFAARRAYGSAAVIAYFILMPALSGIALEITRGTIYHNKMALINPFNAMAGYWQWLFDIQARRGATLQFNNPGVYYFYAMALTCVGAFAVLLLRYRKTEA